MRKNNAKLKFNGIKLTQNNRGYYEIIPSIMNSNGYYFLSNDVVDLRKFRHNHSENAVIIGIANNHFFHVISLLCEHALPQRIIAIDNNTEQLFHFSKVRKMIINSNNRIEFLQKLFKVRFNSKAIRLLEQFNGFPKNYIHGGVDTDKFYTIEREIWDNLIFDQKLFQDEYNLTVSKHNDGLLVRSKTIGDINEYYATFICCSKSNYNKWPFSLAFGCGFLKSEQDFMKLKKILNETEMYLIEEDISVVYENLLESNKYFPIRVWISNLIDDYFVKKHPKLSKIVTISTKLGTQIEPNLPEIDLKLIVDDRVNIKLEKEINYRESIQRNWSIHTKSFNKVSKYIKGETIIEIVNVKEWIQQDNNISKLYKAKYVHIDDLKEFMGKRFDTIFVHILVGHGVDIKTYTNVLNQLYSMTENLIILEHNRNSKDFKGDKGLTRENIQDILGKESFFEYCPGLKTKDRNILLVYRK